MQGGGNQAAQPTAIKGVRLQTSTYGIGRGMIYGTSRVTVNLIWYGDFVAAPIPAQSAGK